MLRLIGEETRKDRTSKVIAQLPVDVANYLLNEKREWIRTIEARDNLQIVLVANPDLQTPNYTLRRVRDDQTALPGECRGQLPARGALRRQGAGHRGGRSPAAEAPGACSGQRAAVDSGAHARTRSRQRRPRWSVVPGLFTRLKVFLFGSGEPVAAAHP